MKYTNQKSYEFMKKNAFDIQSWRNDVHKKLRRQWKGNSYNIMICRGVFSLCYTIVILYKINLVLRDVVSCPTLYVFCHTFTDKIQGSTRPTPGINHAVT